MRIRVRAIRSGIVAVAATAALVGGGSAAFAGGLPEEDAAPTATVVEDDEDDTAPANPASDAESMPVDDPAQAPIEARNFQSDIRGAAIGFQSRRWHDEQYSQVLFTGCWAGGSGAPASNSHIDLRWDRSLQPDKSWGQKKYSNCFKGDGKTSNGQWNDLAKGKHFFQIAKINGSDYAPYVRMRVKKVYVDTTKAD
ncbi:hypothetical protein ABZ543_21830 [Streptomyces roseifaciens]